MRINLLIFALLASVLSSCATQTVISTNRWSYEQTDSKPVELRVGTYFTVTPKGKVIAKRTADGEWHTVKGYRVEGDTIRHTDNVMSHKYYNTATK